MNGVMTSLRRSCSLLSFLTICFLACTHATAATFGLDAGYPGPSPGAATITCDGDNIIAGNAAISASWTAAPQGLKGAPVIDKQSGQVIKLNGEVFQIVLTNGQRYAASAFTRDGAARVSELKSDRKASRLAARIPGRKVEMPLHSADGRLRVLWRAIVHDNANYIRQEIEISAVSDDCAIKEITWMDEAIPDAQTMGRVDGSPVVAGSFFLGAEDPHALNIADPAQGRVSCSLKRDASLNKGETLTLSFVIGVSPQRQMRRAFLWYIERERAHPFRPFLHYNSWYDISWRTALFTESECLNAIELFGKRFIQPHGVVMDAIVFDDGWDDPHTLWKFHSGLPNGFTPLMEPCRRYHTRLGVWLSPFGGYGEFKQQRLKFGREHGFETNSTGFSLAGPKYYAEFKQACVDMIRKYGVNHFKFDGIAGGTYANGGAAYIRDTEAMRRLMLELRKEDPNLYINLTTGSWPSPFWLQFTDSVWRQGGDMGLTGKGSKQQQWLNYRDQETYRNIVGKGPLYPINSLMTQGVAYSRNGSAGEPTFNSAGFKDDVRAFFASGTGLQELYIQPAKLTAEDWSVLAEAAKWSRTNAGVLVDTHWVGGDPGHGEVYGWASWSKRKAILALRNPSDQPASITVDAAKAFELPAGAPQNYKLKSPWKSDAAKPVLAVSAGKPHVFELQPFEIAVWDATPQ